MDKVTTLLAKLNSSSLEKVKENLKYGRYSSWKIPYVEEWIKENDKNENINTKYPGGATWVNEEYDPNFKDEPSLIKRVIENKPFRYAIATIFAGVIAYIVFIAQFKYQKSNEQTNQETHQQKQQPQNKPIK